MALTPNFGLELFSPLGVGWREDATAGALLDYNMMLIDAALGNAGSSVSVNSASVANPNFVNSATVTFSVTGSSVSATATVVGGVSSVNTKTGTVVLSYSDVGADVAGAAATAQSNAEAYANGLASNYDLAGAAATAQSNAEASASSLYIPLSVLSAHGDIIYEDASLGPIRLPIGSTGYLMTVAGGQPAWEAVPTWNQSTTGTAAGLSGTPALPSGTTAATVPNPSDASANVATDAFVQSAIELSMGTVPLNLASQGPATYSFASLGTGSQINFTASGGAITSITSWIAMIGSGYKAGDLVSVAGGNNDAILAISVVGGAHYPTSGVILYGGTGYTSGTSVAIPALSSIPFTFLLSGALSGNIEFLMTPGTYQTQSNQWIFCNNCTGAYTITIAVSNSTNTGAAGGRTVVIPPGTNNSSSTFVQTDGELNVDLVSGTVLPNGTTATTQTAGDNSTKLATTAYVATAAGAYLPLAGGTMSGNINLNENLLVWENPSLGIDAGISRLGAASIALGNGTQGDYSGSLKLKSILLTDTADNTNLTVQNITAANPAVAAGTFSFVGSVGASQAPSAAINTTNATLLVACLYGYSTAATISDSKINNWTYLTTYSAPGNYTRIAYAINPIVGAGHTFTPGTDTYPDIEIFAFSGANITPSVIGNTNGGTGTYNVQPGSVTPSAGDLVISSVAAQSNAAVQTVNDSFTGLIKEDNSAAAYLISDGSAVDPTWAGADTSASAIACFHVSPAISATSQASPIITIAGQIWDSASPSSIVDAWTVQNVIANATDGASTLTIGHTGSTGVAAVQVPILDIGGTDTGISRLGAASIALGNGTQGDYSGSLKLKSILLTDTADNTNLTVQNITAANPDVAAGTFSFVASVGAAQAPSAAINTTNATLLVACLYGYSTAATISDSKINNWTYLTTYSAPGNYTRIAYAINPIVGAGHTFTPGTDTYPDIEIFAFSGANITPSVIGNTNGGTGTYNVQPGSVTPSAGDLVISSVAAQSNAAVQTVNDSFTGLIKEDNSAAAYLISDGSAVDPTWAGADTSASAIACFHVSPAISATSQASPIITIAGQIWDSASPSSIVDAWTVQNVIANATDGASTLTIGHTGSTGVAAVQVPILDIGGTDTGISRLGPASLAIGNGTQGDTSGNISAQTHTVTASSGAPTSAGTAGTIGQIIAYGGFLYYCSVTGGAGSATWNKLTMTAV